jgi:hypothetical protein
VRGRGEGIWSFRPRVARAGIHNPCVAFSTGVVGSRLRGNDSEFASPPLPMTCLFVLASDTRPEGCSGRPLRIRRGMERRRRAIPYVACPRSGGRGASRRSIVVWPGSMARTFGSAPARASRNRSAHAERPVQRAPRRAVLVPPGRGSGASRARGYEPRPQATTPRSAS